MTVEIAGGQISAIEDGPKIGRDSDIDMKENNHTVEVEKEHTSEDYFKEKEPILEDSLEGKETTLEDYSK